MATMREKHCFLSMFDAIQGFAIFGIRHGKTKET